MSRLLNDLDPVMKDKAFELLARLVEADIPVIVTWTRRTQAEQDEAVATGHSKVTHSRHQDGMAIDVVPFDQYELHGPDKLQYDTMDPVWRKIGMIGETLGLRWGGRFAPLNGIGVGWDPGHFELPVS